MKHQLAMLLISASILTNARLAGAQAESPSPQGHEEVLLLPDALSRVFNNHPELTVSELEIQAASARLLQAGVRPNPEFGAIAENVFAMGGSGLFHYTESTLQISQRLETGHKRALRVQAAEKETSVARRLGEVKKSVLIAATAQAFADVLAAQERLANQQALNRLAHQSHRIVVERVAAGKVSPVEQTRATVALAAVQVEEERQQGALLAAKDRLAGLWGGTHQDFDRVQGRFEISPRPQGAASPCLANNPDIQLAAAAVDSRDALLAVEQASRKPDVTVSAGYRRLNEEEQNAWIAGISIPLPLFDKRQGAIAEARIRRDKALQEKKALEWDLRSRLTQARHDLEIAMSETKTLLQTALPAAKDAVSAVEEGYRFGKFDFLNVLDAQRTYAELQRRYIEAVASGLRATIEIDRLAPCDSAAGPASPEVEQKETNHDK
jgi:cobalt-zinc-cadmium efflux system outer membrane protein